MSFVASGSARRVGMFASLLLAGALAQSLYAQPPFPPSVIVDEVGPDAADMTIYGPEGNSSNPGGFNAFGIYNHRLVADLNGDGIDDLVIGADESGGNSYAAGRTFVIFGAPDAGGVYNPGTELGPGQKSPAVIIEPYMETMATGDVNGDGIQDLVLGDDRAPSSYGVYGQVHIIFGRTTPFPAEFDLTLPPGVPAPPGNPQPSDVRILSAPDTFDFTRGGGLHVADVSGDGIDDVIMAAITTYSYDYGGTTYSYAYGGVAIQNGSTTWPSEVDFGTTLPDTLITDYSAMAYHGSMHSGDFNGDGFTDLAITSPHSEIEYGAPYSGTVYVILGPTDGVGFIDAAFPNPYSAVIIGPFADSEVGHGQNGQPGAAVGDFNGDGLDDLALSVYVGEGSGSIPGRNYSAEVHVFSGSPFLAAGFFSLEANDLVSPDDKDFLPPWTQFIVTAPPDSILGFDGALAAADITGDGVDELLLGDAEASRGSASAYSGEAYVILGNKTRTIRVVDTAETPLPGAIAVPDTIIAGMSEYEGLTLHGNLGIGDFNGDGPVDFVVAAEYAARPVDVEVYADAAGAAYVILGGPSLPLGYVSAGTAAASIFVGKDAGDLMPMDGGILSGDWNGDGYGDLLLASAYAESEISGNIDTGVGYVYFSKADSLVSVVRQIDPPEPIPFFPVPAGAGSPERQPLTPKPKFVSIRPADNCGCAPLPEIYGSARAVVDFEDGINSSTTTVTMRRNNRRFINGISPIVGTTWEIETDRLEFTQAQVELHYLDSEIKGLDESQFIMVKGPTTNGPWQQVSALPRPPLDIQLNRVVGTVTGFSTYLIAQAPVLAVDMLELSASCSGAGAPVMLSWSTSSELDNAGFHVYRAVDVEGNFLVGERITSSLIPAQGSQLAGASYTFADPVPTTAGEVRTYFLSDIELDGGESFHGPATATVPAAAPSSVADWTVY